VATSSDRDPGLAAVLSLVYPGLGQIYAGHWFWAIFWFLFTSGLWLTTGPFGLLMHLIAAVQAHGQVKDR
jgi:TM2 domain-containing membrane protein YozV